MTDAEHAAYLRRYLDDEPDVSHYVEFDNAIERAIELLELNDKTGIADAYG